MERTREARSAISRSPDRELFSFFLVLQDDESFAALLTRHAGGVEAACRHRNQAVQIAQTVHPADEMVRQEQKDIIQGALNQLPAMYCDVLVRCDMLSMSRTQTAHELGLPPGTVAKRLVKARRLMREELARWGITSAD